MQGRKFSMVVMRRRGRIPLERAVGRHTLAEEQQEEDLVELEVRILIPVARLRLLVVAVVVAVEIRGFIHKQLLWLRVQGIRRLRGAKCRLLLLIQV
jgi:hypothetical protein